MWYSFMIYNEWITITRTHAHRRKVNYLFLCVDPRRQNVFPPMYMIGRGERSQDVRVHPRPHIARNTNLTPRTASITSQCSSAPSIFISCQSAYKRAPRVSIPPATLCPSAYASNGYRVPGWKLRPGVLATICPSAVGLKVYLLDCPEMFKDG